MLRYRAAKKRLAVLVYPSGSEKWKAFWAGHRAKCMGELEGACPYREITQAEKDRGKRTTPRRNCWLEGHRASAAYPASHQPFAGPLLRD